MKDLEVIRNWIARQPATPKVRKARLILFDRYRYAENYEKLYSLIKELGGKIE